MFKPQPFQTNLFWWINKTNPWNCWTCLLAPRLLSNTTKHLPVRPPRLPTWFFHLTFSDKPRQHLWHWCRKWGSCGRSWSPTRQDRTPVSLTFPGDHILDLCCAPGAKLCMISDRIQRTGSITGVDIAEQRLSVCRTLCSKYGIPNARLFLSDATTFKVLAPSNVTQFNHLNCLFTW